MKMKLQKILMVFFLLLLSQTVFSNDDDNILPPLDFDEVYGSSIGLDQLSNAYNNGSYGYMFELAYNRARAETWMYLNDEKTYRKLATIFFKELEEILDDDSLTPIEKGNILIGRAEIDMGTTYSLPTGQLNGLGQYSIKYDVAKLEWDKKIHIHDCPGAAVQQQCDWVGMGAEKQWVCQTVVNVWIDYIRQTPSVEIYRVVDGMETLITELSGNLEVQRESLSFSADIWKTVKSIYNFEEDPLKTAASKAIFYDFSADLREPGQSLSYRIYADRAPYRLGSEHCGSSENFESNIAFDSNGDSKIDFIPDSKYSDMLGKMYAFMVPVNALILQ
jgi:hypothetical protein